MPATGIFELAAITGGTGRVQADDVLALVDVHDATQAAQGSLVKITVAQLYRTEFTPVTVSTPLPDIAQTWNAGGVTFTAIRLNVTDTASAAASLLLDLQVAGTSKFSVRKDGTLTLTGDINQATGGIRSAGGLVRGEGSVFAPLSAGPGAEIGYSTGGSTAFVQGYNRTGSAWIKLTVSGLSIDFVYGASQLVGFSLNATGSLVFTPAASKIVPGATSLSLRNTADSADNLLITDAGIVTLRNNVLFATDNANDIGASGGPNRPRSIYAGTTIGAITNMVTGYILLNTAAAQPGGTGLSFGSTTAATATLGGGALPASPVAFLIAILNGTSIRIPYYNV